MHRNVFYLWFLSNAKMSVLTQKVSSLELYNNTVFTKMNGWWSWWNNKAFTNIFLKQLYF